jgi:hypothetical protein
LGQEPEQPDHGAVVDDISDGVPGFLATGGLGASRRRHRESAGLREAFVADG